MQSPTPLDTPENRPKHQSPHIITLSISNKLRGMWKECQKVFELRHCGVQIRGGRLSAVPQCMEMTLEGTSVNI